MGAFFSYFILKAPSQEQILGYLRELRRRAAVSITVNGVTVVADEELRGHPVIWRKFENPESYDPGKTGWEPLITELSTTFHCRALAVEVHDSDILYYQLHDDGRLIDEYNSRPDYFGKAAFELSALLGGPTGPDYAALRGNTRLLCETFDAVEREAEVDHILHDPKGQPAGWTRRYVVEEDRLYALVHTLCLPAFAQRVDYYLARGDISFRRERGLKQQFTRTDE